MACSCLGFILVELIYNLKHGNKKHQQVWVGIGIASLIISGFAFASFSVITCLSMFHGHDDALKIAPAPISESENGEDDHQPPIV